MKENEKNNNDEVPKLSDTLTNYVVVKHKNKNKPSIVSLYSTELSLSPKNLAPAIWPQSFEKCSTSNAVVSGPIRVVNSQTNKVCAQNINLQILKRGQL